MQLLHNTVFFDKKLTHIKVHGVINKAKNEKSIEKLLKIIPYSLLNNAYSLEVSIYFEEDNFTYRTLFSNEARLFELEEGKIIHQKTSDEITDDYLNVLERLFDYIQDLPLKTVLNPKVYAKIHINHLDKKWTGESNYNNILRTTLRDFVATHCL